MYHFLYITTNLINKKFYIGKHSTENMDDGYLGSGKRLVYAIKKYGKEKFERKIILECSSAEELNEAEKEAIPLDLIHWEMCYNLALGGQGGGGTLANPETKEKFMEIMRSDEYRSKVFSDELKEKRRKSIAETANNLELKEKRKKHILNVNSNLEIQTKRNESIKNTMNSSKFKGKHRSEEYKENMRKIQKEAQNKPETKERKSKSMSNPDVQRRRVETRRKNDLLKKQKTDTTEK